MQAFNFNVSGERRKQLVGAISEILDEKIAYDGAPTFAYECGGYRIGKTGTVIGEYDGSLFTTLAERGFAPEASEESPATGEPDSTAPGTDRLTIEHPLDGFTPETLDNLSKMVKAKENLLMAALGAEALPVQVLDDRIAFPWFAFTEEPERVNAYGQLIAALCKTAKEKKRVTAKAQDGFENEKFAMRVWLIGLGCSGAEYKYLRKIMGEYLGGNSAWRHGKPEAPETPEALEGALIAPPTDDEAFTEEGGDHE